MGYCHCDNCSFLHIHFCIPTLSGAVLPQKQTQTKGNVDIPDSLLTHSQEEADTLLILHAVSVPHEAELVVSSPDTDVLLLLVHM